MKHLVHAMGVNSIRPKTVENTLRVEQVRLLLTVVWRTYHVVLGGVSVTRCRTEPEEPGWVIWGKALGWRVCPTSNAVRECVCVRGQWLGTEVADAHLVREGKVWYLGHFTYRGLVLSVLSQNDRVALPCLISPSSPSNLVWIWYSVTLFMSPEQNNTA